MSQKIQSGVTGIITGASSGIGKALALLLAERYAARLVITARTEKALLETKAAIEQRGGKCTIVCGDIGQDLHITEKLSEVCLSEYGSIDLLVNNAGLGVSGSIAKLTLADWERVFAVNFFAPLYGLYAVLPHFMANKKGTVVNISSVAGKVAFPGSVCYAASKFALTGLSEGAAAELSSSGIDTITVCPGWVRTEFFEKNDIADSKNPTKIAQKNDLKGILMRHVLSISSEQAAQDILQAIEKGGSREIISTLPGHLVERLKGCFPGLTASLSQLIPVSRDCG
jgi:short-subunit dehydrogenase